MLKANSLLYAIYVCLIVALLCGALLYIANLYSQLNIYYTTHEELYIHNQSLVNYALQNTKSNEIDDESTAVKSNYTSIQYGLLSLLIARSYLRNDTIASAHFTGSYTSGTECLYLSNFNRPLSYSGNVKLIGKKQLPSVNIREVNLNNVSNTLSENGTTTVSQSNLPDINPEFYNFFKRQVKSKISLSSVERQNDSVYFNSFLNQTAEIALSSGTLSGVIIKGNFILHSADSVFVRKSAILEDVIIISPKIAFEDGFKGSVQAFATQSITAGQNTTFNYPSILCIYNEKLDDSSIKIGEKCKIFGGIVNFGFPLRTIENNTIEIEKGGLILGDIYCRGVLTLKSNVYGTVYTNRFLHKTPASKYENCIADIEINISKRPKNFIAFPLFNSNDSSYGALKKLL